MRILVTGGTGFIGRSLCAACISSGHDIVVLSRSPERALRVCSPSVTAISDLSALPDSEHFDAIVNLAGEPIFGRRWSAARKQVLSDSRVGVTGQIVAFIARADRKPAALLSGSAIGFYGDQGDLVLDEASRAIDDFSHRLCAAWEDAAVRARDFGVRVCILRTGLVLGNSGGLLQRMIPPFKLCLGGRLGDGRQWMSWIHLDDQIRAITALLESADVSGTFNLTAPKPVTNSEFTSCLAAHLHRPAWFHLPAWFLRLLFGEMADLLLASQRVIPRRLTEANFQFRHESLESALGEALTRP